MTLFGLLVALSLGWGTGRWARRRRLVPAFARELSYPARGGGCGCGCNGAPGGCGGAP